MTICPKDIKLHKNRPKKSGSGGRLDLELILTSGGYHRAHCCYLMAIIAGADVMSGPVITMCWAHSLTAGHIASASKLLQLMLWLKGVVVFTVSMISMSVIFFDRGNMLKSYNLRINMPGGKTSLYKQSEGGKLNIFLYASVGIYR